MFDVGLRPILRTSHMNWRPMSTAFGVSLSIQYYNGLSPRQVPEDASMTQS